MKEDTVAVGIDCGSRWTRCVACQLEQQRVKILGMSEAPAEGWYRGRIVDEEAVAQSVRAAVQELEKQTGLYIGAAVAGIGGPDIYSGTASATLDFVAPRELTQSDLQRCIEKAAKLRLSPDEMLLNLFPEDFTLDGRPGFRNPVSLRARNLRCFVHAIVAPTHDHESLVAGLNRASVAVEETVFEGLAAAYATLMPEECERGVAVVDVGAETTKLTVFLGNALLMAATFPVGGDHFTRDVAEGLRLNFREAEQLKVAYGAVRKSEHSRKEVVIEIPVFDGQRIKEADKHFLDAILTARAEDLFEWVGKRLNELNVLRSLSEGLVLTGGGAKLPGLCELGEEFLAIPVRVGRLDLLAELLKNEEREPEWTTATGLALYSARLKHLQTHRYDKGKLFSLARWFS